MALPGTTARGSGHAGALRSLPRHHRHWLPFPRFASRLRKGAGEGSCVCRQLMDTRRPALTRRGEQQDANNAAKARWNCEMERPGKAQGRGKRQLAWGSTDTQGLQLSHFQTN